MASQRLGKFTSFRASGASSIYPSGKGLKIPKIVSYLRIPSRFVSSVRIPSRFPLFREDSLTLPSLP